MGKLFDISVFKKEGLTFQNKTPDTLDIEIYGPVMRDGLFSEGVSAKSVTDVLNKNKDVRTITVRINSPGGDVFEGVAIYNRLKQHKAKVTVYVDALAASIASVIAMAGDEVILGTGSLFMVHKPMAYIGMGNSQELLDVVDRLDDVEEQLVTIYAKRTKMERSEIKAMLAAETWLDAGEAIEKGFADREVESNVRIAASCDNAFWIKKKPNTVKPENVIKSKIDEMKKNVEGFLAHKKV